MLKKLPHPDQAIAQWARRFEREHARWLGGGAADPGWPQVLNLGLPTEREVAAEPEAVRAWVQAWAAWPGPGTVTWADRQWGRLGTQRLPAMLVIPSAEALADMVGQGGRWRRASLRHPSLCQACPGLQGAATGQRVFDALADYGEADFNRLVALLRWVAANPASGLYLRQLPVQGLDTKWLEQRRALIGDLAGAARAGPRSANDNPPATSDSARDLHGLLGLARPPARLRVRLLCSQLRRQVGGLGDFEAPIDQLAALPIAPPQALVVENLETGLALPQMPGTVALMKLGHAVGQLGRLPWLATARVRYWGDLDTHGFAILDRARQTLPQTESVLMDQDTLLTHRSLWGEEQQPHTGGLERLTASERQVFDGLVSGVWGARLRLEQERVPWAWAMARLDPAWAPAGAPAGSTSRDASLQGLVGRAGLEPATKGL